MNNKSSNKEYSAVLAAAIVFTLVLSAVCLFFNKLCAVFCLILGIGLGAVFVFYTSKRLKELNELNAYLSLVCSGKYELRPDENTEGEISILKNNLFKVVTLLKAKNEMLKKDKTYLADSLADISHQLKTPLTSMMVMTDLLKNEKDEQKRAEFISITETQLEKMTWLITNLLKLSKLDADTVKFFKEPFSAKSALEESLKPFLVSLDLKGIEAEFEMDDFQINGDKKWTVEAFSNIIKNCIEHMDKNGKLKIRSTRTSVYDSVIIIDNGCGISPQDIDHIFERFYHGKNASQDSVGIGLALSKAIFDKENAKISVKSQEGKGSEFEIRFYKAII
ncbi:MAG: sensor histidine kinase [Acutalibacteraceae bacterium]